MNDTVYGKTESGYRCINAEPGTFNHECGMPAQWIGSRPSRLHRGKMFRGAFCNDCRERGTDARSSTEWTRI